MSLLISDLVLKLVFMYNIFYICMTFLMELHYNLSMQVSSHHTQHSYEASSTLGASVKSLIFFH